MNDDVLLADLLVLWGEARDAGQPRSAAELCRDAPHLLTRLEVEIQIQERWEQPAPPALVHAPVAHRTASEDLRSQMIGPYQLLELLGEGGMGSVWVAEQHHPIRRKVAIKVIKAGMDTKQVLARFEAERQALALMDHPNIAKVLDAGMMEGGRPYFVMELIQGMPITDYCDRNRLAIHERVTLFISVCQAIQHAHQKGVIHRDIKPSNVLVAAYDGKPVAKVIDFGVAKAMGQQLTERTLYTGLGGIIGTLQYMSPEQAEFNALDIDTRSDIYSLGVLLYELLTGTTPLTKQQMAEGALTELLKSIREQEPPKPSTRISESRNTLEEVSAQRKLEPVRLAKYLRGDLDWVVMRSLDKDRNRRYESATSFALDLQRFLNQEPVEARPPSMGYRLSKFSRKHRVLLATVAIFFGVLSLATLFSIWQAVRATQAEQVAKANERQKTEALEAEQRARETAIANEAKAISAKKDADDARDRAEWTAYLAHIQAADAEWDRNQVASAFAHLEACPKKLRGWEHDYLFNKFKCGYLTLSRHINAIRCVAISSDGTRIAAGDSVSYIKIWDAATGQEIRTLGGHTAPIFGVAFSPDGTRIVSGSLDKTIILWDSVTGQQIKTMSGHDLNVTSVAFSPDGMRIVSGSSDQTIKLWDVATGQETRMISKSGHATDVRSVAFSANGELIASGGLDATIIIWDLSLKQERQALRGHTADVNSLAFNSDGQLLVSGSRDQSIKLWNVATGLEICTYRGHTDEVTGVAFTPDGQRIVSGSIDSIVMLWDAFDNQCSMIIKSPPSIFCVAVSPDGSRIVGGNKIFNAANGEEIITLRQHSEIVKRTAFSPDGQRLVTGSNNGTVNLWSVDTREVTQALHGHTKSVNTIHFSPNGKQILSAGQDNTVRLWDAETGQEIFNRPWGSCAAFSPAGQWIACGSNSRSIQFYNTTTKQAELILRDMQSRPSCLVFSPDSQRIAAGTGAGPIEIWDVKTGQKTNVLIGHSSTATSLDYSPDGMRIVSGSDDRTVKLWDAVTGQETFTLRGHTKGVQGVTFSPDGKRIVSGSLDGTVRLWDGTPRGVELNSIKKQKQQENNPSSPSTMPSSPTVAPITNIRSCWGDGECCF